MKAALVILALSLTCAAQEPDWKFIKEMSGNVSEQPNLIFKSYAAQIARGNDIVKLLFKVEFPNGAPEAFRANVPTGFDYSSIVRVDGKLLLNCKTLVVKPIKATANVYQFNGNHFKSKEPPFTIGSGHIFATYFCEQGNAPTVAPKLKPIP